MVLKQHISFKQTLGNFLSKGDLLPLMLAVYLGDVLEKFFSSVIRGALLPLMMKGYATLKGKVEGEDKDKSKKKKDIAEWDVEVEGVKIKMGEIMSNFISLMLGVYVAYLFSHYFVQGYLNK